MSTQQEVKSLQEIVAERIMANKIQHMRAAYHAALEAANRELFQAELTIKQLERENDYYYHDNWGLDCTRCGANHEY